MKTKSAFRDLIRMQTESVKRMALPVSAVKQELAPYASSPRRQ